jgi:hypothetical protein
MDTKPGESREESPQESIDQPRLDKSHFSVVKMTDPDDSLAYWLSRPVEERLQALERLRRTFYCEDYDRDGIQRVLEVVPLERY